MAYIVERPSSVSKARSFQVKWTENGAQRSSTVASRAAAKRLKAVIEVNDGTLPDLSGDLGAAPTFTEHASAYLAQMTGNSRRTLDDYRRQIDQHMLPMFGELPMPAVTSEVVRRWVNTKALEMSGKTLKNLHGLLHGILAYAVPRWLPANPSTGVRLPRDDDHERGEMAFLSRPEFYQILDEIPEHWRPAFTLLAGTGLRLGELMALNVGDLDLLAKTPVVKVTKSLHYTRGEGFAVGPTKTKRSRRTVSLSRSVAADLAPLAMRPPTERLVTQPNGRTIYPTNLYARVWRPALLRARQCLEHRDRNGKACGCPGTLMKSPRIHDLRHSHASWLIAEGTSLVTIQRRLGHESIVTTIDRYGHLAPDMHIEAAEATERAMARR